MANLLSQIFYKNIDFEGQRVTEKTTHYALIIISILSFLTGLALQSLQTTFFFFGASVLVLTLVIVPPWPAYNTHPVKWLPRKGTKKSE
ncbi:microsomal signal peptidase 12 kDa subunit [Thelephora ganbajun]|uniref:Microsomal signal peptidase 12 kDa subunit n=1 Tax=Thelephora ganbajun TaxID=370292 RepID=A0ACB6ZVA8_THEGA|nr:microsomal signal peptidase 12 kDa subunit [Thelephora ganbajun]